MSFAVSLIIGAVLVAAWLDVRFDGRRPASLMRRFCHLAAGVAVLQVTSASLPHLLGANAGDLRQLLVVFFVLLPGLVYGFLGGLWLMRTLAEVAGMARR
jgi:hypothetical protein